MICHMIDHGSCEQVRGLDAMGEGDTVLLPSNPTLVKILVKPIDLSLEELRAGLIVTDGMGNKTLQSPTSSCDPTWPTSWATGEAS